MMMKFFIMIIILKRKFKMSKLFNTAPRYKVWFLNCILNTALDLNI